MNSKEIANLKAMVKERHANGEKLKDAMVNVAKDLKITPGKVYYAYYKAGKKIRKRDSPGFRAPNTPREEATITFDIKSIAIKNNKLVITVTK